VQTRRRDEVYAGKAQKKEKQKGNGKVVVSKEKKNVRTRGGARQTPNREFYRQRGT